MNNFERPKHIVENNMFLTNRIYKDNISGYRFDKILNDIGYKFKRVKFGNRIVLNYNKDIKFSDSYLATLDKNFIDMLNYWKVHVLIWEPDDVDFKDCYVVLIQSLKNLYEPDKNRTASLIIPKNDVIIDMNESIEFKKPTNIAKDNLTLHKLQNFIIKKDDEFIINNDLVDKYFDNITVYDFKQFIMSLINISEDDLKTIRHYFKDNSYNVFLDADEIVIKNDNNLSYEIKQILHKKDNEFLIVRPDDPNNFLYNYYIVLVLGRNNSRQDYSDMGIFIINKNDIEFNLWPINKKNGQFYLNLYPENYEMNESMEFKKPKNIVEDNIEQLKFIKHFNNRIYESRSIKLFDFLNMLYKFSGKDFRKVEMNINPPIITTSFVYNRYIKFKKEFILSLDKKIRDFFESNKILNIEFLKSIDNNFLIDNYVAYIKVYKNLEDRYTTLPENIISIIVPINAIIIKDKVIASENIIRDMNESIEFKKPINIVEDNLLYKKLYDELNNNYIYKDLYNNINEYEYAGMWGHAIKYIKNIIEDATHDNNFKIVTAGKYGKDLIFKSKTKLRNDVVQLLKNFSSDIYVLDFKSLTENNLYLCLLDIKYENDNSQTMIYMVTFFINKDDLEILTKVNESVNFERPKNIVEDNFIFKKLYNELDYKYFYEGLYNSINEREINRYTYYVYNRIQNIVANITHGDKLVYVISGRYKSVFRFKPNVKLRDDISQLIKDYNHKINLSIFDLKSKELSKHNLYLCLLSIGEPTYKNDKRYTAIYEVTFFINKDDLEIFDRPRYDYINESVNFERPKNIVEDNTTPTQIKKMYDNKEYSYDEYNKVWRKLSDLDKDVKYVDITYNLEEYNNEIKFNKNFENKFIRELKQQQYKLFINDDSLNFIEMSIIYTKYLPDSYLIDYHMFDFKNDKTIIFTKIINKNDIEEIYIDNFKD